MRFVDVRNLLGKTFCDYLLTADENFRQKYLSLEVPQEYKPFKEEKIQYYETFIGQYKSLIPAKDLQTVVKLGQILNREKQYFEAHEVIEKYWLNYQGKYKKYLQALIQVAIANMHLESGNLKGYQRMKEFALKNLEPFHGNLFGVDIEQLRTFLKRKKKSF